MSVLKELPLIERPRERLELSGAESLSIAELLAIIIRTGTKNSSSINLSYEIMREFEDLDALSNATISELCKIKGIQKAKAISIIASLELGKRLANSINKRSRVTSINDIYNLLKPKMELLEHEEFMAVYLNVKGDVIKVVKISKGTVDHTLFDEKEVIKWALRYSSMHFFICHNHPSGDVLPSDADKVLTMKLDKFASMMGLKMLDHLILAKGKYYSFKNGKVYLTKSINTINKGKEYEEREESTI